MKKRALNGFGLALVLGSPLWITYSERPDYVRFGISLSVGIVLLLLAYFSSESETRTNR